LKRTPPKRLFPRAGLYRDLAELLLEALDELRQRAREALGIAIIHDNAVGHLQQKLGLTALRIRIRHVKAQIDNHLIARGMNALRDDVGAAQLALIEHDRNALLLLLTAV
jgi:hypothetical protein